MKKINLIFPVVIETILRSSTYEHETGVVFISNNLTNKEQ